VSNKLNDRFSWPLMLLLFMAVGIARAESVMSIQTWETANGAQVLYYPTDNLPIVDARVIFDAGSARDGDLSGVAQLTASLLSEGAGGLSGQEIANGFAKVGAEFSASATRETSAVRLRSLSDPQRLWPAVELLSTVIESPEFSAAAFEREKRRQLLGIQAKGQSPSALANDALMAAAFAGHPYGQPVSGTTESVSALSLDDVKDFYKRHYTAANAWVVIVGNVDREDADRLASQLVGGLREGERMAALPPAQPIEGRHVVRVPFPSEQSTVQIVYNGIPRLDEDYFPLYVGNHVFGGSGFASKLTTHIREQRGLAYSVYSYLMPLRAAGLLLMGIQTRNDQVEEAVSLMMSDLGQFVSEGPTKEELADSQANIIGGFPLRLDSNAKITETIGALAVMGLPLDYFDHYTDHIAAIDPEQIRDAFARRIDPNAHVIIIVGPDEPAQSE